MRALRPEAWPGHRQAKQLWPQPEGTDTNVALRDEHVDYAVEVGWQRCTAFLCVGRIQPITCAQSNRFSHANRETCTRPSWI